MPGHDIIVVGASAGGVEALIGLVGQLPENFPASLFVVLHIPAQSPSLLPEILGRSCPLVVSPPQDEEEIRHGHIYVAPPDKHLLIGRGHIHLSRGPRENRHRPAIDPLFRSAAYRFGTRVVGVVLTGSLDDGTAGLWAIKQRGGIAIVQDPKDALYPSMPGSAMAHIQVDYCLPLSNIGAKLVELASQETLEEGAFPVSEDLEREIKYAEMEDRNTIDSDERVGAPSAFSCPECGGVLWEFQNGDLLRFRCRVGHAFSVDSVLSAQSEQLETALWAALKTLEENASLSRRLAQQANKNGQLWLAQRYEDRWHDADQQAITIRQVLRKDAPDNTDMGNTISPTTLP